MCTAFSTSVGFDCHVPSPTTGRTAPEFNVIELPEDIGADDKEMVVNRRFAVDGPERSGEEKKSWNKFGHYWGTINSSGPSWGEVEIIINVHTVLN